MAKILFLTAYFQGLGGTERVVMRLAKAMAAKHEVELCSLSAADCELDTAAFDFPCSFMEERRRLPLALRWIRYAREARWLRSVKRGVVADVTISNLWRADLINVLSGGPGRKISLLHAGVIGSKANTTLARFRWLAALVYQAFDRIVAVSTGIKREAISLYRLRPDKIVTIPNALEDLPRHARAFHSDLIWCGRFVEEKNPLGAVAVLRDLLCEEPSLSAAMIGDGPLLAACKELAASLASDGIRPGRIAFLGGVPRATDLIGSSRLLISTSRAESFGLVLLEAIGQGVPVVAADSISGGPHEVLGAASPHNPGRETPECTAAGYLMPLPVPGEGSIGVWVQAVRSVLSDEAVGSRFRAGALERAADFSSSKIDRQWEALLDELL